MRAFWLDTNHAAGPEHIETQGAMRDPGDWFACEHPERPWNWLTCIHDCCPACMIAVEVELHAGRTDPECVDQMRARMDEWGPAPRLAPERAEHRAGYRSRYVPGPSRPGGGL